MEFKWNDKARVHMIEKSEFYNDSQVYQYGFYDGYMKAIKDCNSNEMLEMLIEIRDQIEDGRTYVTKEEIEQLIKSATQIK